MKRDESSFMSLGRAARYLGLRPNTVFWLSKKGVFNPERDKNGRMVFWADEVKALADKEGKTPVVVLCEKNRPGFWIMVRSEDFLKLS